MIPKVINYCWFGGNKLPKKAKKCIKSWKKYLKGYEIVEWNESNFDINAYEYTKDAYSQKKYAFVSDMARLIIMYNNGGIYFDTDVELIAPIDDLLNKGYLGIEMLGDFCTVNPGLGFACEPKSAVVNSILEKYKNKIFDVNQIESDNIVTTTTNCLKELGFDGKNCNQTILDVVVYRKEYFNPIELGSEKIIITENTRSIHHYAASWVNKKYKIRGKIYKILYNVFGEKLANKMRNKYGRRKK